MKILSIDQSYTNTGYCVLDETEMLDCGLISSSKDDDIFKRAFNIAYQLVTLADSHQPTILALEGLAFSMRGNATRDLAGLQFTIVNALRINGYPVTIVPPNVVKKTATGKGNAKKEVLLEALPEQIRYHFEENVGAKKSRGLYDLTDAYWIGKSTLQAKQKCLVLQRL